MDIDDFNNIQFLDDIGPVKKSRIQFDKSKKRINIVVKTLFLSIIISHYGSIIEDVGFLLV